MEPVSQDILEIKLSSAQVDKGNNASPDKCFLHHPLLAQTTSHRTFKMSVALERNGKTQERLEAHQEASILCAENVNCFPFNGQSSLQEADEVICETKVLHSLTTILMDSKAQNECLEVPVGSVFHREREGKTLVYPRQGQS